MSRAKGFYRLLFLIILLVFMSPASGHSAVTDPEQSSCPAILYGHLHSICAEGVQGSECLKDGEVGKCSQTEVACLCKTQTDMAQEFLLKNLYTTLQMILNTDKNAKSLEKEIACSQIDLLFGQIASAMTGLQDLGSFTFADPKLLRLLDTLLLTLDTLLRQLQEGQDSEEITLHCLKRNIEPDIVRLRAFILAKKLELLKIL